MKMRAVFIVIVGGRLEGGGTFTHGPSRFLYGFKYGRRIYQWNVPDRLYFP